MPESQGPSLGREMPWRRAWLPTPVFSPGKFHRQKSPAGYSPWGRKGVRYDLATKQQQQQSDGPGLFACSMKKKKTQDSLVP